MAQQGIWRTRLEAAEKSYDEASVGLKAALVQGSGVAEARARKVTARAEYLRVLRIFSDLVLRGKAPGPDAEPQAPNPDIPV
jgi:hypothetical protein